MKKTLLILILIPVVMLIPYVRGSAPNISLSLTTDKRVYASTEPIAMALTVLNTSNTPCKVTFSSSFVYDFILYQNDQPIWKWSAGKMFAQMINTIEFKPNKPKTHLYVFSPGRDGISALTPGEYKLVGSLQTMNKTYLSDPIRIEIRK